MDLFQIATENIFNSQLTENGILSNGQIQTPIKCVVRQKALQNFQSWNTTVFDQITEIEILSAVEVLVGNTITIGIKVYTVEGIVQNDSYITIVAVK